MQWALPDVRTVVRNASGMLSKRLGLVPPLLRSKVLLEKVKSAWPTPRPRHHPSHPGPLRTLLPNRTAAAS